MTPKHKLALLLWSVSPEQPALCAAPFVYASAAAAMDCEVEIHFAADAVRLLAPGVAAYTFPSANANAPRSVLDHMQDAAQLGARFLACSMALHERALALEELIPECTGAAGATAFVVRTLDPEWATLVF
ncbi:MAG: DsrE family protein [Burkholderiales bacterium]|nr:DsrE family protein [Burkholderiales bacterium]